MPHSSVNLIAVLPSHAQQSDTSLVYARIFAFTLFSASLIIFSLEESINQTNKQNTLKTILNMKKTLPVPGSSFSKVGIQLSGTWSKFLHSNPAKIALTTHLLKLLRVSLRKVVCLAEAAKQCSRCGGYSFSFSR